MSRDDLIGLSEKNQSDSGSQVSQSKQCRWCGAQMSMGYRYCPNCHRGQRWFAGLIGSTGNVIAVLGAVLTLAQLLLAMNERQAAASAAEAASQSLTQTDALLLEVSSVRSEFSDMKNDATRSAHQAREALLEVQQLKLTVDSLAAASRRAISESQEKVDQLKNQYSSLEAELAKIPTEVEVQETRTTYRTMRFLGVKTKVPQQAMHTVKRSNPKHREAQARLDEVSLLLREAERELGEAIETASGVGLSN